MGEQSSLLGSDTHTRSGENRNKARSRFYFFVVAIVFLVLLVISAVSLGTFGMQQNQLSTFHPDTCVLFSTSAGEDEHGKLIKLNSAGLCIFILWGLASIGILSLLLLIYSIILAIAGPKV